MQDEIDDLKKHILELEDWQRQARISFFQDKVGLLRYFTEKFGQAAVETLDQYIYADSFHQWEEIARSLEEPTLEQYVDILWNQMCKPGGIEFEIENQGDAVQMHVTKCPFADRAIECGAPEWGYRLYCMTDYASVAGFSPNIEFTRTKTLMEGHDCCNHAYRLKKE